MKPPPVADLSASQNRITPGARPRLLQQFSFNAQNLNSKPLPIDPKRQQKAGSGTMVEAGVGMDGFIEGCVWKPSL